MRRLPVKQYICKLCGYIYDEAAGIPESGIPEGTPFSDLPEDFVCPLCGVGKDEFALLGEETNRDEPDLLADHKPSLSDYSDFQLSAICSNLARGLELQYKPVESELFRELAAYYKDRATSVTEPSIEKLMDLVDRDINELIGKTNDVAKTHEDHGAQRALVWNEKVSKILKSCLTRYQAGGEAFLEDKNVYICSICGFIFLGDKVPELCPICKVPSWKFDTVGKR